METLEPRLLLSAAPVALAPELLASSHQLSEMFEFAAANLTQAAVSLEVPGVGSTLVSIPAVSTQSTDHQELVFIDETVQDREQLLSGLAPTSKVVWLDSTRDGIEQISAALAGRHDLDAVHILSHGTDRAVKLGATWLTQETLATYAEQIAGWRSALADGADLLFYACDLAGSATGQSLLGSLQQLTGADVAASTNDTGHAQFGADWTLEYQLGTIETGAPLSQSAQDNWVGLLAPFTVTTAVDSGGGSLRQAILDANALAGLDTITFNIPGTGVHTITPTLASPLPTITGPVIIDGYTQPGSSPNALTIGDNSIHLIEIDGNGANVGLALTGGNSVIRGLVLNHFLNVALTISGGGGNIIEGNFIGTNAAGTAAANNGNGLINIVSSAGNLIGGVAPAARNVIAGSGNLNAGIAIQVADSTGNMVQGNYVGTNAAGTAALGNSGGGVVILSGASNNTVGGIMTGAGNLISGNAFQGVWIQSSTTTGNNVQGNLIGTNAAGTGAIANALAGVKIDNAPSNVIGGTTVAERNVISGNTFQGVVITGVTATGNFIRGNYIGTDTTGNVALGNGGSGIELDMGASANTIGGTTAGARNIVSGNNAGIAIFRTGTTGNLIQGNYIGTNATGTVALGNQSGVIIQIGAAGNIIGGLTATPGMGAGNVISGNLSSGVILNSGAGNDTVIQGNLIGLSADGVTPLANVFGIWIVLAVNTQIGGDVAGARNVISGNIREGVRLSGAVGTVVQGNYIGMNRAGTAAVANGTQGVLIDAAANTTIGGTATGAGNVISGNLSNGILIQAAGATGNLVQGNLIGTNAAGTAAVANARNGVELGTGATNTTIGGLTSTPGTGAGNVISGNGQNGIELQFVAGNTTVIQGNLIGLAATGTTALSNGLDGVVTGNSGAVIGGTTPLARNVISANRYGINLSNSGSNHGVLIQGNYIGTDLTGNVAQGNSIGGVLIGSAPGTIIGGEVVGAGNLISGNNGTGIAFSGISHPVIDGLYNVKVQGNLIGTNAAGTAPLANGIGISLLNANNLIGGTTAAARNVISGNTGDGVQISGAGTLVQGNYIGTNAAGAAALGNAGVGVVLTSGANNNTIGGTAASTRNVISGNASNGILIRNAGTTGNLVQGNFIGTNAVGTGALGNGASGVVLTIDASNNTIGGLTTTPGTGAGNVISGNTSTGISIAGAGTTGSLVQGNLIGTNAAGTAAVPNGFGGIHINNNANNTPNNTIGGTTAAARNVISGNNSDGIRLNGSGIVVQGNFIGTDVTGTLPLGNGPWGILVIGISNTIGGNMPGAGNVISGNNVGIDIRSLETTGNLVQGNYIGTDVTGLAAIPNAMGIQLFTGTSGNRIGGTTAVERNVISGNTNTGVNILGTGTTNNRVQGNYIGLKADGTAALGNGVSGVVVNTSATNNTIGGTAAGAGNVISGNAYGIFIQSAGTSGNLVQGNFIGTNSAGTAAVPNGYGMQISNGASSNTVGGTVAGARNVISGNNFDGVRIAGAGSNGNLVQGNYIGTDVGGTAAVPNGSILNWGGVDIDAGASNNTIGGTTATARNIISGNGTYGILVNGAGTTGNLIQGNYVGTNAAGNAAIPTASTRASGIVMRAGSTNNTIGGSTGATGAAPGNVIAGNTGNGITLYQGGGLNTTVQGNLVGVAADGVTPLGNGAGIHVDVSNNTIGGTAVGAGNVIAYNAFTGVNISAPGVGNLIQGNSIFANGGLGIGFDNNVLFPNDVGDGDTGPNNLQNFPVLTSVFPGSAVITGTLNSTPNTTFVVEFFSNPAGTGDPSGFGEGRTFLGRTAVTANASGNAAFSLTLGTPVALGEIVTATATDPQGNTSEFSAGVVVTNAGVASYPLTVTITGTGSGTVTSLPLGINTTVSDTTELYPANTLVTLTAVPSPDPDGAGPLVGSVFLGWTGQGIDTTRTPTQTTLSLTMSQARTVTANFGLVVGEAAPPVVTGADAQSVWLQSLTFTWDPAVVPANRTLLGYLVRVSTVDGVFSDPPIFVPPFLANGTTPNTSLTLTGLPPVPHFFTVSALTQVIAGLGAATTSVLSPTEVLLEPATATGTSDLYAVPRGGQFATVRSTGVLVNDTGVNLVAGFATPPAHGSLVFNPDGTFLYRHNGDTATSDSFTYRVGEGTVTATSPQATVTITIAQEGGQSQVASGTPVSGLEGWTIQNETTEGGASTWSGVQSPVYSQSALTGATTATLLKPGTDLIKSDGLPNGRIDYTLTFTIKSDGTGAMGIMFRYLNAGNYYRFSMFNGEGGQQPYFRLVKVTNGTPTVLQEILFPVGQAAYVAGRQYTLTIKADDLPNTTPVQTDLIIRLQDPQSGLFPVDWALTDTQNPTATLQTSGLALYSARNAGSTYSLLSVTGLDNTTYRKLEVRTSGTGLGIVRGTIPDATQPGGVRDVLFTLGAPVTSLPRDTPVTLTATEQVGGRFGGWTDAQGNVMGTGTTLTVTLDQAIGLTKVVTATFTGTPAPAINLDVDGNRQISALTDGVLLVRYLFGVRGTALTQGAVGPPPATGPDTRRTDPADIVSYLDQAKTTLLDVDGNGTASALTDGVLLVRYLFGVRGSALTQGAVAPNAHLARNEFGEIEGFISGYMQVTPVQGASAGSTQFSSVSSPPSASNTPDPSPLTGVAISSSSGSALSTQDAALLGDAIAATQLSSASVQSAPWVSRFVGVSTPDDEEVFVTL